MSKKFCAKDAKKLSAESVGHELEDRNGNFAWILKQIEKLATTGVDSLTFNDSSIFTPEMLCELSNRGFILTWVPDDAEAVEPSICISWEPDDE